MTSMNLNPLTFEIDEIMQSMPVEQRYRWCETELCACLGCCNRSSKGLVALGFTKGDWLWWRIRHPEPKKDKYGRYIKPKGDIE